MVAEKAKGVLSLFVVIVALLAAAIIAAFLLQSILLIAATGQPSPRAWLTAFGAELLPWACWAILLPLIVGVLKRLPLGDAITPRNMLVYLGLGGATAGIHALATTAVSTFWWQVPGGPPGGWQQSLIIGSFARFGADFVSFSLIAVAYLSAAYYRADRDRAASVARLALELNAAELRALRAQLDPHFLFNTLNAIVAYIRPAPEVAEVMISRLSTMLRATLALSASDVVPLEVELELARLYLDIHEVRFGSRLTVRWHVDPDVRDADVPAMLIQPIIENAIRHGVGSNPGDAWISVAAARTDDSVRLCVADSGSSAVLEEVANRSDVPQGRGIGLSNTLARLQARYGDRATFKMTIGDSGETSVIVEWPLERSLASSPLLA